MHFSALVSFIILIWPIKLKTSHMLVYWMHSNRPNIEFWHYSRKVLSKTKSTIYSHCISQAFLWIPPYRPYWKIHFSSLCNTINIVLRKFCWMNNECILLCYHKLININIFSVSFLLSIWQNVKVRFLRNITSHFCRHSRGGLIALSY